MTLILLVIIITSTLRWQNINVDILTRWVLDVINGGVSGEGKREDECQQPSTQDESYRSFQAAHRIQM